MSWFQYDNVIGINAFRLSIVSTCASKADSAAAVSEVEVSIIHDFSLLNYHNGNVWSYGEKTISRQSWKDAKRTLTYMRK